MSGGGNAFTLKEQEREARRAEIAKFTAEMMGSAPVVSKHPLLPVPSASNAKPSSSALNPDGEYGPVVEDDNYSDEEDNGESDDSKEDESDDEQNGPQPASSSSSSSSSSSLLSSSSASEDILDTFALENKIPVSHVVNMPGHTKAVTCISCEPAGNRVVTGSLDYNIKVLNSSELCTLNMSLTFLISPPKKQKHHVCCTDV